MVTIWKSIAFGLATVTLVVSLNWGTRIDVTHAQATATDTPTATPALWPPLRTVPLTASNLKQFQLLRSVTLENYPPLNGDWLRQSPDWNQLIAIDSSGLRMWDARTGQQVEWYSNTPDPIGYGGGMVSPDWKKAAVRLDSTSGIRFIIWDIGTGKVTDLFKVDHVTEHQTGGPWQRIIFSPDSKLLFTVDYEDATHPTGHQNGIRVWNVSTGKGQDLTQSFDNNMHFLGFTPDAKYFFDATTSGVDGSSGTFKVTLWNWKTLSIFQTFTAQNMQYFSEAGLTIDFTNSGKTLVVSSAGACYANEDADSCASLFAAFDLGSGQRIPYIPLQSPIDPYEIKVNSPSGHYQVARDSASINGLPKFIITDLRSHQTVSVLDDTWGVQYIIGAAYSEAFQFSPDETVLEGWDGDTIALWNVRTGEKFGDFNAFSAPLPGFDGTLGFNQDWSRLLSYDPRTGTLNWWGVPG